MTEFSADYWDAFRIVGVDGVLPRTWAGLALAGADAANRAFGRLVWHATMGFDLVPRGASNALVGWRITSDTADRIVLDVDGTRSAGRMVLAHDGDDLVWTTMLRHHGRAGTAIWAVIGSAHRALVPRRMEQSRCSLVDRA